MISLEEYERATQVSIRLMSYPLGEIKKPLTVNVSFSEIMKTETELEKKPNHVAKSLDLEITSEPLVEFPSLYSPELYQVSQTCSSIHQNPIPVEEPSPSFKACVRYFFVLKIGTRNEHKKAT